MQTDLRQLEALRQARTDAECEVGALIAAGQRDTPEYAHARDRADRAAQEWSTAFGVAPQEVATAHRLRHE